MKNIDFSDEAMFRVSLLLQSYDDPTEELNPQQEAEEEEIPASMNITFFLYVIKDALEFGGLLPKITPAR